MRGINLLVLSGGTGGPKLLIGLLSLLPEEALNVIVNTGDDMWVSSNLVCPDVDTVIYTIARVITEHWWGRRHDTFRTYEELIRRGYEEEMIVGDFDRATHIMRTQLLRQGHTLTQATHKICESFSISATVLPMTDDFVPTTVITDQGEMHIQDFLIKHKRQPRVVQVKPKESVMTRAIHAAFRSHDSVIIGPSNPVSSIGPIMCVRGMRQALKDRFVLAVSPIIRGEPISGPARKFMQSEGLPVNACGVAQFYEDFLDVLVIDSSEPDVTARAMPEGVSVVRTDILLHGIEQSKALAGKILAAIEQHGK
ncbi:MAG: 2-phospho-L-lactate transferase [Halobacteriota archaeon]